MSLPVCKNEPIYSNIAPIHVEIQKNDINKTKIIDSNNNNQELYHKTSDINMTKYCFLCDYRFQTEQKYFDHLINENQQGLHQCIACAGRFKFKKEFLKHICVNIDFDDPIIKPRDTNNLNDYSVDYACKFCTINNLKNDQDKEYLFDTYNLYLEHINKTHLDKVKCFPCDLEMNSFNDYLEHLQKNHQIEKFNDCNGKNIDVTTYDNEKLQYYIDHENESKEFKCGICKYSNKDQMSTHLLTHVTTGTSKLTLNTHKIYCSKCKNFFNFQHDFNLHLFDHVLEESKLNNSGGSLYCPVCEGIDKNDLNNNFLYEFESIKDFHSHLNENHLNFKCGICFETENTNELQTGHLIEEHYKKYHLNENVLTKIPNYERKCMSKCLIEIENVFCNVCNRFFPSSQSLDIHLKNHPLHTNNEKYTDGDKLESIDLRDEYIS